MNYISRYTQANINLTALVNNYQQMAALSPQSQTVAVIKADAYGHGAIEVAKALEAQNEEAKKTNVLTISAVAVAFIDEALALRNAGVQLHILVLEGAFNEEELAIAEQQDLWLMIHNPLQLQWLHNAGANFTRNIWLKVDTGMSRLGFMPDDIENIIHSLSTVQKHNLVLCSHLSDSENTIKEKSSKQIEKTLTLVKQFHCQFSLANSAAIINWPQSRGQWNRLGIALYGSSPLALTAMETETETENSSFKLQPVMTLKASIIAIRKLAIGDCAGYGEAWQATRPSTIATVAIGYGDGYPRHAKNGTPVYLHKHIVPLVGHVSMDMITIDITDLVNDHIQVALDDKVELWGENLPVETVAEHADTISYELLTRVSARVPRIYSSN